MLPRRPFWPPGLRFDFGRCDARLARSARATASSRDGGIDEFVEFFPSCASNSATRARSRSFSANTVSRRASNSTIRVSVSTTTVYTAARVTWRIPTHRAIPRRIKRPLNSYAQQPRLGSRRFQGDGCWPTRSMSMAVTRCVEM